jgi:hypothetical protein
VDAADPTAALDPVLRAGVHALVTAETAAIPELAPGGPLLRAGRTLWHGEVRGFDPNRLADRAARLRDEPEEELDLALRNAIVLPGKFSRGKGVKVRSYVVVDGQLATLKVWQGFDAAVTGARERKVRARIAGIDAYRTPPILRQGEHDGVDYLLEPAVFGRHPSGDAQRLAAAVDLGGSLADAYVAAGLDDRRLSEIVHPEFRARLEAAFADPGLVWDPAWGARAATTTRLFRLVDRDRSLPGAITHGDLVASNVIRDEQGRHHLVDWEHGRRQPVAFDLVKLMLSSGDWERALRALAPAAARFDGRGVRRYRWHHQLALGLAQFVSWSAAGRRKAAAAGRLQRFDVEQRQRLSALSTLLNR